LRVVVFETEDWEHAACLRLKVEHRITCTRDALDESTAPAYPDAEIISTFINSNLGQGVLGRFPRLKLIATRSTGYDHIDLDYCKSHGITVCNVPDYGDATVAEYAFALILAVTRNLVEAVARTRAGSFSQAGLRGMDLRGKTLGVIGTGRIGRRVIAIAKGFGMAVSAFDIKPDPAAAESLGFAYAAFESVLAQADIVTLHVPAGFHTRHLLSDREFGMMKNGAVLINTARGSVVDIAALVRALTDGKLRAVGLDVLPDEPLIREEAQIFRAGQEDKAFDLRTLVANHVLLHLPNVVVTPHIAYDTDGAVHRIIETTLANIEAFSSGQPRNVVSSS
jgi:D-lactate dehydrogenase